MDQQLSDDPITKETTDWTYKEQKVAIVIYGDDIPKYERLFSPFNTYLISYAKFREPHSYSIRASTYEWVVKRHTIVEAITNNSAMELTFPPPRKLNTLPFRAIERLRPGVKFDLLGVVANCSVLHYTTDQSKHFREAIIMDQSKKHALFTIWDNLADNKGSTFLHHLHEHPVILAKNICVTEFRGVIRLSSKYQTMILVNPKYMQAPTLMKWYKLSLWKAKYHFLIIPNRFTCSSAHTAITLYASRQKNWCSASVVG